MPLPKIQSPVFQETLPGLNRKISYRPFTVEEEKILLIANQSKSTDDIIRAIKQIIKNCVLDTIPIDDLNTIDIEILFLLLRIVSVSNTIELPITDPEDGEVYKIEIDLNEVIKLAKTKQIPDTKIMLSEDIGVQMKPFTFELLGQFENLDLNNPDNLYKFFGSTIDFIYDQENIYKLEDETEEEIEAFFNSFNKAATQKLADYFNSIPRITYEISYENNKGKTIVYKFEGLSDFFI